MQDFNFASLQDKLVDAKEVLILLPKKPSLDATASGLALYMAIKKAEKNVLIASPTPMKVRYNRLYSIDKIKEAIGSKNLIISFDYKKEAIEKVSYNVEDGKFNLVVQPQTGSNPLNKENVEYSYSGTSSDLIFVIGAKNLTELDKIYADNKDAFTEANVVNIDINENNQKFGKTNYVDDSLVSRAEIVIEIIKKLNLPVNGDIATNLLVALEASTNNFGSGKETAYTFESAAWCLKTGANRGHLEGEIKKEIKPKKEEKGEQTPPPDWLKPKIYKSDDR